MIYQAQVIKLNEDIEEEVDLQINGVKLNCFASICPYAIEEGKSYPVKLELIVLDDYEVKESLNDTGPAFVQIGKGFAYLVQGRLNGTELEAGGLVFEDEVFQTDFGYLDGKMVTIRADRIGVEFLEE